MRARATRRTSGRRRAGPLAAAVGLAAALLSACSSAGGAAGSASYAGPAVPCGFRSGAPAVSKVMVVWEENFDYDQVIGSSDAPELNGLARRCGLATNDEAYTHPSLPNYLAMTSGRSYARGPWNADCEPGAGCRGIGPSIFAAETAAGHTWRSYVEAMPSNCDPSGSGLYDEVHNPAVYYTDDASSCSGSDVPLGSTTSGPLAAALRSGGLPALSTVTPDVNDDLHNGTLAQADAWLRQWMPAVLASPDYRSGRLAVIILWDEGSGVGNVASHVALLVLSASTKAGTRSGQPYDDFSVLRTITDLTGVAPLGKAATATSLVGAFGL